MAAVKARERRRESTGENTELDGPAPGAVFHNEVGGAANDNWTQLITTVCATDPCQTTRGLHTGEKAQVFINEMRDREVKQHMG